MRGEQAGLSSDCDRSRVPFASMPHGQRWLNLGRPHQLFRPVCSKKPWSRCGSWALTGILHPRRLLLLPAFEWRPEHGDEL